MAAAVGRKRWTTAQLELSRLAQLWPDLHGQLAGEVRLSGTADAPSGTLALDGRNLGYPGQPGAAAGRQGGCQKASVAA